MFAIYYLAQSINDLPHGNRSKFSIVNNRYNITFMWHTVEVSFKPWSFLKNHNDDQCEKLFGTVKAP